MASQPWLKTAGSQELLSLKGEGSASIPLFGHFMRPWQIKHLKDVIDVMSPDWLQLALLHWFCLLHPCCDRRWFPGQFPWSSLQRDPCCSSSYKVLSHWVNGILEQLCMKIKWEALPHQRDSNLKLLPLNLWCFWTGRRGDNRPTCLHLCYCKLGWWPGFCVLKFTHHPS